MLQKKNGYSSQTQSVYNNRIRNYAIQALRDLALLAEKLPEKQQAQIFNEETVSPLANQILRFRPGREFAKEEAEERRKRVLELCSVILEKIGKVENAYDLAPDIMGILMMGQSETLSTITALKAIYLKGFTKRQTIPAKAPK